jgi:hypothetical protein
VACALRSIHSFGLNLSVVKSHFCSFIDERNRHFLEPADEHGICGRDELGEISGSAGANSGVVPLLDWLLRGLRCQTCGSNDERDQQPLR